MCLFNGSEVQEKGTGMIRPRLFTIVGLFFVVSLALVLLPTGTATAQVKEICTDGIDNDGDKLIDCKDPDCAEAPECKVPPPPPPGGIPCSPGFWKNHPDDFNAACDDAAALAASLGIERLDTCGELLAAVSCKGSDASCLRSLAASLLNTVSGCQE
jgi:hypothetical protein